MKVCIYARYSSEMQRESFSLEAQLTECRRLAESRGWTVVAVYTDEAESAKTTRRPAFQQMLVDAKLKKFDAIVVHKLDRFSRSLIDLLLIARDLHELDLKFVSATEDFDFTTPIGWMMMVLLAMLAEWFLKNLRTETSKGKKARAQAGYWNGQVPFGYCVDYEKYGGTGIPVINEEEVEGVRLMFERYATGVYSDGEIAQLMNEAGYRVGGRGPHARNIFHRNSVRAMLTNRFYIGEVSYKGEWYEGLHESIITPDLFEECQRARAKRTPRYGLSAPKRSRVYLLTGIARCARCGGRMYGQFLRYNQKRYYVDSDKKNRGICDQHLVRAEIVEKAVADYLAKIQIPDDWLERVKSILLASKSLEEMELIEKEKRRLESILERLKELYEMGDLDRGTYTKKRDHYTAQLQALKPVVVPDIEKVAELFKDFQGNWEAALPKERKQIVHTLVDAVYLDFPPKVVRIELKPEYQRLFEG